MEGIMNADSRMKYLRIVLLVVGVISIVGLYPLTVVWPSGWAWNPGPDPYLPMVLVMYAVLGVFLVIASRDPLKHLSLIWFTVWSSVAHALLMLFQALADPSMSGHLLGDIPTLLLIAAVFALLTPRGGRALA